MKHGSANTTISVWITPGSQRNEVIGLQEGYLRLKIAAPPEKGKANEELVKFLARSLHVAKEHITILTGLTSRRKVLVIAGLGGEEVMRRLIEKVKP